MKDHPQRIAFPVLPGTLLKRLHDLNARMKVAQALERDPVYLTQIRQLPCLKCGCEPAGEAAHLRMGSGLLNKHGGMAKKPADRWAIPLCPDCHRNDPDAQHKIGELKFWHQLQMNPLYVADRLYKQRGDIVAMRAVIIVAIAERG